MEIVIEISDNMHFENQVRLKLILVFKEEIINNDH